MGRGLGVCALVLALSLGARATAAEPAAPELRVELAPTQATVGDPIGLVVEIVVPPGTRLEPPELGSSLGPFAVVDGRWAHATEQGERWTWTGHVAAYRTGRLDLPPLRVSYAGEDGQAHTAESASVAVEITSVLGEPPSGGEPAAAAEIADLKPPASIPPDYRALWIAGGVLGALLAAAGLVGWLQRRYGSRLARVAAPSDPFHRTPPHEWAYAELQKLLERRLTEPGQVTLFFAELSHIVKRYLGGRFRVELMEQTSEEVPARLHEAGAQTEAITLTAALLERCDRVKFARETPLADECRATIEEAYRVIDLTKPRAAQGAA